MIIGSGWKKKDKNGKPYISAVINVPFLGSTNVLIYQNERSSKIDYDIIWIPDNGQSSAVNEVSNESDFPI